MSKGLFGASSNVCAYTGCEQRLTDPSWKEAKAESAPICHERPAAPLFDPSMSDDEQNSYENLILVCPKHHKLIDRLDPQAHPVEVLVDMRGSELHGSMSRPSASPEDAGRFAMLLAAVTAIVTDPAADGVGAQLRVGRFGKRVTITTVGSTTASDVVVSEPTP